MKNTNWVEIKEDSHQIDNGVLVECIAEIKNNETGEIREYETHEVLEIGKENPSIFNWKEDDFSCDCNRRIFFKRVNKEEITEDDWNIECSDGKFSVNLKNKKDGKLYYCEYFI